MCIKLRKRKKREKKENNIKAEHKLMLGRYFSIDEFLCKKCLSEGRRDFALMYATQYRRNLESLALKLNTIRHRLGFPLIISSGIRCRQHNKEVGGAENSAHVSGLAADIVAAQAHTRYLIVKEALKQGICRIGVYTNHVHLDISRNLPQEVFFIQTE